MRTYADWKQAWEREATRRGHRSLTAFIEDTMNKEAGLAKQPEAIADFTPQPKGAP